jgi:hypothetical protein
LLGLVAEETASGFQNILPHMTGKGEEADLIEDTPSRSLEKREREEGGGEGKRKWDQKVKRVDCSLTWTRKMK